MLVRISNGDLCHQRAPEFIRRMNTLAALAAATARAASEIAQLCCAPPFPCCLWEMEVFEDVDKAGVVALLSATSLSILPIFESRGIQTCRAETLEQQPLFVLIASDSEGNLPPFTSSLHVSRY